MQPARRTVHVYIHGRVQGVGYRAWVETEALRLGLDGWVRNRRDGSVEAVFSGSDERVARMLAACEAGPPAARVDNVATAEDGESVKPGFTVLPTA